ncbi:ester cyclase [Chitinophaga tropicalis]|uniref:ABM domain-containing protein n=1 Tax=Chitinophaga tropicalis TaxID=2683588 RepID=A0A7K1U6A9_9BACT|nr:ester cyclase [Chitinophaga tropicalis]MVT09903.1 hypothetical protein [Chitinophaga tropicalis]
MKNTFLLLVSMLVNSIAHAQPISENKTIKMNKTVVNRLYEEVLNKRNMTVLNDIVSEEYTSVNGAKGPKGFEGAVLPLLAGFPDISWEVISLTAEDDRVIAQWEWRGTHRGQFQEFPATGKQITNRGATTYLLKNGRIVHSEVVPDRLGFRQEMESALFKDKVCFIDKFLVPAAAQAAFRERVTINRKFIKQLPGFIKDAAYEYTDNDGNLVFVTVAQWVSRDAFNKAREAVQAEYKKEGFDAAEMFKRLNITADRGLYTELQEH